MDTASCAPDLCVTGTVTQTENRPVVPVPTPSEVAASLPEAAVQYDLENPPVSGSVQRVPADS